MSPHDHGDLNQTETTQPKRVPRRLGGYSLPPGNTIGAILNDTLPPADLVLMPCPAGHSGSAVASRRVPAPWKQRQRDVQPLSLLAPHRPGCPELLAVRLRWPGTPNSRIPLEVMARNQDVTAFRGKVEVRQVAGLGVASAGGPVVLPSGPGFPGA